MVVGGAAAPRSLIEGFRSATASPVSTRWGMTEMAPMGTTAQLPPDLLRGLGRRADTRTARSRAARCPWSRSAPAATTAMVPWDGATMGELEVRGPWIARAYYDAHGRGDRWTDDGWFKTGDVVTIDARGCIEIQDRSKDLDQVRRRVDQLGRARERADGPPGRRRGGGDRGAGRAMERAPARCGRASRRASRRPPRSCATHLAPQLRQVPAAGRFEFVDAIPRTAVGKFKKTALREQFAQVQAPASG